jgi:hypothetical protein
MSVAQEDIMARIPSLAAFALSLALPSMAAASEPVSYSEPVGVDAEAEWASLGGELQELASASMTVVRGDILTTREDVAGFGPVTVVAIVVDEVMQGDMAVGGVVDVAVPLQGPVSGERSMMSNPVRGYEVIAFLDHRGDLVEDGLFVMEGGFAWRPNRPGLMLSPRLQQDWDQVIDPIGDYDVYTVDAVRNAAAARDAVADAGRRSRRK